MRIAARAHSKPLPGHVISRRSLLAGGVFTLAAFATGCGINDEDDAPGSAPNLDLQYPRADLLADANWLAGQIDNPALRLLDCSPLPVYRAGHLPNARHVWWQDTIEVHNPVYGMLVNPEGRAEIVRQAGIMPDSLVVCYDDSGGVYAARILWMLRYMGFRAGRLLIGGQDGWHAAGYGLTRDAPDTIEGGLDDIFDESIAAQPQDILARLDEPGLVLLDTRTAAERDETWNGHLRSGVIPGSVWLPRDRFFQESSVPVPLPAAELASRLSALFPLEATAEVILYGLHGTLASLPYHLLLALDRFHSRLYDGSWAQWSADASLPVEPLS